MAVPRKPRQNLRRPERAAGWWTIPPTCPLPVPAWPEGKTSPAEKRLWTSLWRNGIANIWHAQGTPTFVVSRYVKIALAFPSPSSVSRLETDLGLTPIGLMRLRVTVEDPEPATVTPLKSRYDHVRLVDE